MSVWVTLPWTALLIMLPLTAALIAFLAGRRVGAWLNVLTAAAVAVALVGLAAEVREQGPQRYALGGWEAPLGIALYADGLSLLMLAMTAGVGVLVGLYAPAYFRDEPRQASAFWPLWLLLWMALNALFLAGDIFNLYVTLELLTLSGIALIVLAGGAAVLQAALRYLVFALLGSLAYLLGVALLYGRFGTLDLVQIGESFGPGPDVWLAVALITLGLLTKTAIFPLHVWLPPAHASAPAPVSALLSALVVKGSLYLLLRLWLWVFPAALTPPVAQLLGLLGAAAVLYGSLLALCQTRIKLLVAYSTVAQLGYLLLLFPLAGALAWGGAVYQILSHAFAKAALFLAAGNILQAWGHDRLQELSGLSRTQPLNLYAIALAGVSLMGLPPSGGFVAKWLLLRAAVDNDQWWWAGIILVGGLLAAAYLFRLLQCGFKSQPVLPVRGSYPRALPRSLEIIPLLLAAVALGLGFIGTPTLALLAVGSPFAAAQATP